MDLNKLIPEDKINQIIEKEVVAHIHKYDLGAITDSQLNEVVYDKVEELLDDRFYTEGNLEKSIESAVTKEINIWIRNNMGNDDIKECLKSAFVEKLKELEFAEIKELMDMMV